MTDLSKPPFTVDWSPRFDFGGPRSVAALEGVCVHTTENDFSTRAEDIANYQLTSQTGSYHVIADSRGTLLRENTDDWVTWSSGNRGNNVYVHIAFVARARFTRAQWLSQDRMLRAGALYVAHWCKVRGFPAIWRPDLRNRPRGITTHNATRVFGGTDHTDPGPNFPHDVFIRYVNEYLNSVGKPPAPIKGDDEMTPDQARQLAYIAGQLGPWPQLGKNDKGQPLTLVDAVAELRAEVADLTRRLEGQ